MKTNSTLRAVVVFQFVLLIGIAIHPCQAASACASQDENFDSYPNGSSMHGPGGWTGWENNPVATAFVTQDQYRSPLQSVDINGPSDLVHPFCASGGAWSYSAWQYIPSDFASGGGGQLDGSYFMLLNRYPVDADPNTDDWSVQMQFDSNDGMLKVYHGNGLNTINVPYDTDRWVKIQVIVDLENDWTDIYYDDDLVSEYSWTGGVLGNGGGALDIAAVDLYANDSNSVFYDDLVLERIAPRASCGEPGTAKLDSDFNLDLYIDLLDLHLLALNWLEGVSIADIFPTCGDEATDLFDFGVFAKEWQECLDPTNPACTHKPLTLYEPPNVAQAKGFVNKWKNKAKGLLGKGKNWVKGMVGKARSSNVYLFSGEFTESVIDLNISGLGLDFTWARKYRSRLGPATAMGNGWDFSHNIHAQMCGSSIFLHDGNGRKDKYRLQPDGTWVSGGFFRRFTQNPDSSLTLTFPDTTRWNFHPLDGSPQEGKINEIIDRNGNTLSYEYDANGRLTTIRDTLGIPTNPRLITINYNPNGFIDTVTDYTGRSVTYEYYNGVEPGGNFGDLKSVTTPEVTGTSTGNDFPDGKTTVYTYSTGFDNDCLNHNLLTITDPKGQTYLTNDYGPTTNPDDLTFDRVTRQVMGNPGDIIDFIYLSQIPDISNNYAVTRVVSNDRVGNVSENFYDNMNRVVVQREYTGRANPDTATSINPDINLPVLPLRASDPAFFETRYEYNADSLLTQITYPNLNEELFVYDQANPSARSRGNLLQHSQIAGPLGGDQSLIIETFEYDPLINNDTNRITCHVDGRGNQTLHTYDSNGNRTQTVHRIGSIVEDFEYNIFGQMTKHTLPDNGSSHRRTDVFRYYTELDGCMNGYLKEQIIDEPGFALTTTYEYDCLGRRTRIIDPRGHDSLYEYNSHDQIVRASSRRVSDPAGARYVDDLYYDYNDNVVRIDIQNIDENDVLLPNTHFTTVYEYDILNYMIRECHEVEDYTGSIPGPVELPSCTGLPDNSFITTEYEYDDNRNQTLVRSGEATEGRQPDNVVQSLYDERDQLFQTIRAPGSADQSTDQFDYDGNGNVERTHEGLENSPRITESIYDGYDRLVFQIDPMGNRSESHYDENSNKITLRIDGELLDIPGDATNVRLFETTYEYDPMDRRTREITDFFDTETQAPILAGPPPADDQVTTDIQYSNNSQVIQITDDNLHSTIITYDSANRKSVVTDPKNNSVTYTYDNNSNIISITEVEKSDLLNPDETFVTTYTYDNLDRMIRVVDPVGNTTETDYDSRDNDVLGLDALLRETRYTYDGLDRRIQTIRDLDGDGADGDGTDIVITQTWDDSLRLIGQTDDNGNTTQYEYDPLNRLIRTVYADGTDAQSVYDVHDNIIQSTDAAGNIINPTYDLLNRQINRSIAVGVGVSNDTTAEIYQYDGLSRPVRAEDDDTVVLRSYDSLSRVISETLTLSGAPGRTTTSTYDGVGNQTGCTYPGGLPILTTYDELDRKKTISDNIATFANYSYIGPDRVERRVYSPGFSLGTMHTDYQYDGIVPNPVSDFGVKQIVRTTHTHIASGNIIDDRSYTHDPLYNKTQRTDIRSLGPQLTHDYVYDSIYRLTRTIVTDPAGPVRDEQYGLDRVGNRNNVIGGSTPGAYAIDPTLPIPGDFQVNQYTSTPFDLRLYDDNGNLIRVNDSLPTQRNLAYDYRDRMVQFYDLSTLQTHTYTYDALDRRVMKIVDSTGSTPQETRYYYDGWQVVEETDSFGITQAQYIYGNYIDEVLVMLGSGSEYFYHSDDLYNVMAITDSFGSVVERYDYGDFGEPIIISSSGIGNPYFFNGRRYDEESGLYYYRTRYLDSKAGRFVSRDTIGIWGDSANLGNGTIYAGNNPWSNLDPFGLMKGDFTRGHQPDRKRTAGDGRVKFFNESKGFGSISGGEPVGYSTKVHLLTGQYMYNGGGVKYILKDYNYRNPTGIPGGAGGGVGTSNELSEILINGATTGGGVNLFIIFDGDYGGLWDLSGKVNAVGGGAVRGNKLFVGGLSWNGSSGGGQYRETDFNFISRLMQEEGIWWGIGGNSSYSSPGERVNRPIFGSGLSHTREHVLLGRQVGIPTSSNHGRVSERLRHKNHAFIPEIDDQVLTSKKSKLAVDGIVGPGQ
jgi:RHS repeat-associated protein